MTEQNRTPAGVPTGGQFTASARAESDVALATEPPRGEQAIRDWLLAYAWANDSEDAKQREVDCIMAQGDWKHLSARVEHLMAQRSGENDVNADLDDAEGFALSALYECHDAPHTPTCPYFKGETESEQPS